MTLHQFLAQDRTRTVALAKRLGVTPAAVRHWSNGTRVVPGERCRDIQAATQGAVTCPELRADIFGAPPQAEAA